MSTPQFLFGPVPHDEAIDFIKSKPVVSRQVFNGLLPELKARAFTITGVEGANVLQGIRDRIADLPAGHHWDDVKRDIANDISPFMIDPAAPAEERDAQINAANRRAELLLRTHGFQAYQSAQYKVMDRQRDALPFWQYLTMEDERVRPEHAALDKIVLPQDHPFWQGHFPPWDWGCRCQVVPISQADRDEIAEKDAKLPPDQQLVLEGPQADHLTHGQLVRNGRAFDVRTPPQKEGGSGFAWHPGDLRIPLQELKNRYDPVVWAQFETWARKTPLGQAQPTVWGWLEGKKGPPPLPRITLDEFMAKHTHSSGRMTPEEAKSFIDALEQKHGIPFIEKTEVHLGPLVEEAWKPYVEYGVQEFMSLIPAQVLKTLPKFETHVVAEIADGSLGTYNMGTHQLKLNAKTLQGNAELISQTIFHELAHWVHLHGPEDYRKAIKAHYNARTAHEKVTQLPNYSTDIRGKKDRFWDVYMGRVYKGIPDGSEIPTTVFELLTNPSKLSLLWAIPLHRETIKASLAILFP